MSEEYRNEEEYDEDYYDESGRNKRIIRILLIILALILIIFGAIFTGFYIYNQYAARLESEEYSTIVTVTETTQENKVKNPIDFKKLQKNNDELYAWLKVPGTKVDYPIVQSKKDDSFYLKHSALDKSWLSSGAIYTEMINSTDFTDRVTVIYGHNGYSDTMFTTLHRFEDSEFFDSHDKFYIYLPDAKLTYKIVSAFKYDDRHIMNSFLFEHDDVFDEFLQMIQNPEQGVKNVRKDLDRSLTITDNIVVLSTCIKNQTSKRYLVCGVLVSNEKTD